MAKRISLNWWQLALVAIGVSAIGGLSSMHSHKKNRRLYSKKLKQAPWSLPARIFAPVWNINNFFLLLALQQLINDENIPHRKKLLALQGMIWGIYFSFGYVYFNKKSPVLAAIWTKANAVLALISVILASRSDKKLAACYLPLLGWTAFASSLADYQALHNEDPLLKTKPLITYIPEKLQRIIPR